MKGLFQQKRIAGLDILRIYAVVSIFLFHCNIHLGIEFGMLTGYISNGAVAMILFFMLSGFVLQMKYDAIDYNNRKNLCNFYKKRIVGLYPLYLVVLLIWGIFFVRDSIRKTVFLLPIEALGLQGFFDTLYGEWNNSGTWFVTCLLLCYFLYPFLSSIFMLLNKKNRRILGLALYLISSISPVSASILNCNWVYPKPIFRLLEFAIGALLAIEIKETKVNRNNKYNFFLGGGAIILCVLIIAISMLTHFSLGTYASYNFIAIPLYGISLISFYYVRGNSNILVFLANISYAFFYAQTFVFKLMAIMLEKIDINSELMIFITASIATFIIAILMNKCIETPIASLYKKREDMK